LAVTFGWTLSVDDVSGAFLCADVDRPIYVVPPEGVPQKNKSGKKVIWELKKALYGLKSSPRLWGDTLRLFLVRDIGMDQLESDPCVYVKRVQSGKILLVGTWVDDILSTGSSEMVEWFRTKLHERFKCKGSKEADQYLGMRIERPTKGGLALSQEKYIEDILEEFGMSHCKKIAKPISPTEALHRPNEKNDGDRRYPEYRKLIGCLNYISTCTRPDIAYVTGVLSRSLDRPTPAHWRCAKRVLRYLKGTKDLKIIFRGDQIEEGKDTLELSEAYADASWANGDCRKSIGGYITFFNGCPISWRSRHQSIIAASSTEAEYIQLAETVKEIQHIRNKLSELGINSGGPTDLGWKVYEDNIAAITLASTYKYRSRSKHIDLRMHLVRDAVRKGIIQINHVKTENQVADIFTRGLKGEVFRRHRSRVLKTESETDENDCALIKGASEEE